jgi:hypothetical protein
VSKDGSKTFRGPSVIEGLEDMQAKFRRQLFERRVQFENDLRRYNAQSEIGKTEKKFPSLFDSET